MALEYLLRTNEYNQPQVLSGKDAIATNLILLLNMKKGTDPRHPLMGIDMMYMVKWMIFAYSLKRIF